MSDLLTAFIKNESTIRKIIRRYFTRTEDIEDLTQETFLKCFLAEAKIDIDDPRAFLITVAKNTALSEIKKKSRTTTEYLEESTISNVLVDQTRVSPETELDSRQKLMAITKAIAGLPLESRQAFLMRKMEGLKYRQIALRLNLPVTTVHRLIAKALIHCSATLREQGYEPSEFGVTERESSNERLVSITAQAKSGSGNANDGQ